MPNGCSNQMFISGDAKLLKAFHEKYFSGSGDKFDFNRIIPEPKGKKDCPIQYIVKDNNTYYEGKKKLSGKERHFDGYNWRYDHWGCKGPGDILDDTGSNNCDCFTVYYNTPGGPAIEVVRELQRQNPEIRIANLYYEPGCWFAGTVTPTGEDGECSDSEVKQFAIDNEFDFFEPCN